MSVQQSEHTTIQEEDHQEKAAISVPIEEVPSLQQSITINSKDLNLLIESTQFGRNQALQLLTKAQGNFKKALELYLE
jgi:hypothetical protein